MIRPRFRILQGLAGLAMLAAPLGSVHAAEIAVEGVLHGADGGGVPGARVELRPVVSRYESGLGELEGREEPGPVAQAGVDRMGRFRLSAPRTGLWRLVAVASGYVTMEIPAFPILEEIRLPPVTLRSDAGLRVRVMDSDGNPVAGAQVLARTAKPALWRDTEWRPVRRLAVSGPEGTLRLARAGIEPLRLWAEGPGFPAQGGSVADGREAVLQLQPGTARQVILAPA
ncbi:MAG: hypothetical protein WAM82_06795, partial [Thermoanaerobaculia bacterium]